MRPRSEEELTRQPPAGRFLARDESHMQVLARHFAVSMIAVRFAGGAEPAAAPASSSVPAAAQHAPGVATDSAGITVRYFPSDDSVFIDDAYLIKGVPGRIFQKLFAVVPRGAPAGVHEQGNQARSKLEAARVPGQSRSRLILLRRRLEERTDVVRLDHVGRGRLRLSVVRPVRLKVEGEKGLPREQREIWSPRGNRARASHRWWSVVRTPPATASD